MEGSRPCRKLLEGKSIEMLHQVLYNVYKKLSNKLQNNTSKNVVFACRAGLGRQMGLVGIQEETTIKACA